MATQLTIDFDAPTQEELDILEAQADILAEYREKKRSEQVDDCSLGYEAELMGVPGSRTARALSGFYKGGES